MEILRERRMPQPFALAYVDCDNFKAINDRFDREVGDNLLISVARTLTQSVRKTDIVARLGSDEFGMLLPETGAEQSSVIVQQLRKKLTERMTDQNWPVSFSFGIAVYTRPPDSVEAAIRLAEALMYRVKQAGKDDALQEVF
jgi:diguanylate cyclase (GGDEF)-like protein